MVIVASANVPLVMSPATTVPHVGAAELVASPVCVMNFFIIVVFPAKREVAPEPV